jgi:hypothetical protein
MLPLEDKIHYLIGNPLDFRKEIMVPYDPLVCDFLNSLSVSLLKDKASKAFPDIISFGFWCRKGNIAKLKEELSEKKLRLGLGLIFHICPSNVPVNFAFSFAFALLAGNSNIVRVPSKDYPQIRIICDAINKVLIEERYSSLAKMTAFVRYEQDDEITQAFCNICNGRVIWGGTQTILDIRRKSIPERAVDVSFADRYSFCIINAEILALCSEKEMSRLAAGFYNDTYLMDQNACSSPHLVIWVGDQNALTQAKNRFWQCVYREASIKYTLEPVFVIDKLTSLYKNVIDLREVSSVSKYENFLYLLELNSLPNEVDSLRGRCGYFYEYFAKSLDNIKHIVNEKYQTLTYYGFEKSTLSSFVLTSKLSGIDRIVPIGSAMDISIIWDGFDLVERLSRICDVK